MIGGESDEDKAREAETQTVGGKRLQQKGGRKNDADNERHTERREIIRFLSPLYGSRARDPFSFQYSSGKGKQSVYIKDWINPQSDSFSVKQLFIGLASHG